MSSAIDRLEDFLINTLKTPAHDIERNGKTLQIKSRTAKGKDYYVIAEEVFDPEVRVFSKYMPTLKIEDLIKQNHSKFILLLLEWLKRNNLGVFYKINQGENDSGVYVEGCFTGDGNIKYEGGCFIRLRAGIARLIDHIEDDLMTLAD